MVDFSLKFKGNKYLNLPFLFLLFDVNILLSSIVSLIYPLMYIFKLNGDQLIKEATMNHPSCNFYLIILLDFS